MLGHAAVKVERLREKCPHRDRDPADFDERCCDVLLEESTAVGQGKSLRFNVIMSS